MRQNPPLEFFDLETIRLAHFMALRRINDENGFLHHYYVIGQPTPWERRIDSIAKLVRFKLLIPDKMCRESIECILYLTEQGEKIYQEFIKREESGELKRNMEELQRKRRQALEDAYNEYMELKRLSEQDRINQSIQIDENTDNNE